MLTASQSTSHALKVSCGCSFTHHDAMGKFSEDAIRTARPKCKHARIRQCPFQMRQLWRSPGPCCCVLHILCASSQRGEEFVAFWDATAARGRVMAWRGTVNSSPTPGWAPT